MPRSKRFRREGENAQNVSLTDDDYQIMLYAIRRRLITNEQLRSLFPNRSKQNISRRTKKLFNAGLLDKPEVQTMLFRPGGGSNPHAMAITDCGVKLTAKHYDIVIPGSRWSRRNEMLRPQSIEHILETTDFMTLFDVGVGKYPNITMADGFDTVLMSDEARQRRPKPLSFDVPVQWRRKRSRRGIEPDELIRLTYTDKPRGKNQANFLVEIDRGTETIEPSPSVQETDGFYRRSSILLKFVIYANAFRERTCECFGFKAFRLLMVAPTETRMRKMQELERKYLTEAPVQARPGFVLYTNQKEVSDYQEDILVMPWLTRDGKAVYLNGQ